jgi:hypothetical protein
MMPVMATGKLSLKHAKIVWDDGDYLLVIPHYMDRRTWWHFKDTFEPWLKATFSNVYLEGAPRDDALLGELRIGADALSLDPAVLRDALAQHVNGAVVQATAEEDEDRKRAIRFVEVLLADE